MHLRPARCLVCDRPAGGARQCRYCDEPLPLTQAARCALRWCVGLAVLGATALAGAFLWPATATSTAPFAAWAPTPLGLALAALLGALSGICPGLPLPVLLMAGGAPPLLAACALGSYALTACGAARLSHAADPSALPFGAPALGSGAGAAGVLATAWTAAALAFWHPRAAYACLELARRHGGWLLMAGLGGGVLLAAPSTPSPIAGRWRRLRWAAAAPLTAGLLAVAAGTLGRVTHRAGAGAATPAGWAALGMFGLAPWIWRRAGLAAPVARPWRGVPAGLRTGLLLALALWRSGAADDPWPPLLAFGGAATAAALALPVLRRAAARAAACWWPALACAALWLGLAAAGGGTSSAAAPLAAAWSLAAGLALPGVAPALGLAFWLAWLG